MSNLWTLKFDTNNALPLLVRGNASDGDFNYETDGKIYGKLTKGKLQDPINVIQDFPWTKSPKSARDDVPRVQLIEKRLLTNSTLTNFFYSILAGADIASSVAQRIENGVPVQIGGSNFNLFQSVSGIPGSSTLLEGLKATAGKADGSLQSLKEGAQEFLNINSFDQSVLKPYEGLYITEDTGFQYILPYFNDNYSDISMEMGGGGSLIANALGAAADAVDIGASFAGVDKPGVYIEGSKQFNMKDQGRTINIKFPLLNTGEYSDITRNWQLIYGLIYQNRPGRINRSLIDVPVIYELFIEGLSYMPYAYMSKMSVNFLGSRRRMKIKVPTFNIPESRESSSAVPSKSEVVMTVPDAYMVDIQLTGLNDETRNFLFRSLGNTIINSTETTNEFTLNPNATITTGEVPITTPNSRSNKTPRSVTRI
jgi:hypothetical protein